MKGNEIANEQTISCQYSDYFNIKKHRNGKIWDSKIKMLERIKKIRKENFNELMNKFFKEQRENYYNKIFFL